MSNLLKILSQSGWREESKKLAEQNDRRKYSQEYKTQSKNYNTKINYRPKH
jgi:hypothetical protein